MHDLIKHIEQETSEVFDRAARIERLMADNKMAEASKEIATSLTRTGFLLRLIVKRLSNELKDRRKR
jgi:hypothetical protein